MNAAATPITRPITTRPLPPARASSPAAPATALAQRGCVAAPVVAGCCWSGLAPRARCRCPGRRTSADRSMGTPPGRPWRRPSTRHGGSGRSPASTGIWSHTSYWLASPAAALRQPKRPRPHDHRRFGPRAGARSSSPPTHRTRPAPHRRPPAAAPGPARRQARRRRRWPTAMTAATGPSVTRKGGRRRGSTAHPRPTALDAYLTSRADGHGLAGASA
jgi:hypothetical protein